MFIQGQGLEGVNEESHQEDLSVHPLDQNGSGFVLFFYILIAVTHTHTHKSTRVMQ